MASTKQVSFGGGVVPSQPAQPWQIESQGLNRRRALMDALMAQNMAPTPIQTVSGRVVNNGILDGFTKIATALALNEGYKKADQQQADVQSRQVAAQNAARLKLGGLNPQTLSELYSQGAAVGNEYGVDYANDPAFKGWVDVLMNRQKEADKGPDLGTPMRDANGNWVRFGKRGEIVPVVGYQPPPENEIVNGVVVDKSKMKPGDVGPQDFNDLVTLGADGKPHVNPLALQAKSQVAASGASRNNITVNTDKKFSEAVASKIGDRVVADSDAARSAVNTIGRVSQIRDALATGKVIAGPGANAEITLSQVGQRLGFNNAQALAETRKVIQGLASLELDAAQQMKGQGQITEAERQLIKRAAGGDITMTVPEIESALDAVEKVSRGKIRSNASSIDTIKQNPDMQGVPFQLLNVPEPEQSRPPRRVRNPKTGEILEERNGQWVKTN